MSDNFAWLKKKKKKILECLHAVRSFVINCLIDVVYTYLHTNLILPFEFKKKEKTKKRTEMFFVSFKTWLFIPSAYFNFNFVYVTI